MQWKFDDKTLIIRGDSNINNYLCDEDYSEEEYNAYFERDYEPPSEEDCLKWRPWDAFCMDIEHIVIEDGIKGIGARAFKNCIQLSTVTIPDSITFIGSRAFENCAKLTSVNLSESLTSIGDSAFENCAELTSVNLPESLTHIGEYAFMNCTKLTPTFASNSKRDIGYRAFSGCKSKNIKIPALAHLEEYAFDSDVKIIRLSTGWNDF